MKTKQYIEVERLDWECIFIGLLFYPLCLLINILWSVVFFLSCLIISVIPLINTRMCVGIMMKDNIYFPVPYDDDTEGYYKKTEKYYIKTEKVNK